MTTFASAAIAAQCQGTPTVQVVDNRGLAVRSLQYNRSEATALADELITQQRYTVRGHLHSQLDPRLAATKAVDPAVAPNFRYDCSLSGRPLRSQSQDAGTEVQLFDVEGGTVWKTDSRAQRTGWTYDVLHRLTMVSEQAGEEAPERISERFTYANGTEVAAAANCRGRLVAQHDTAGRNETPRYSLTGQVQVSVRRLLQAGVAVSDWQGSAADWETALDEEAYTSRQGLDALGRVIWSQDARGNRQTRTYNVAGQPSRSQLQLAGQASHHMLLQSVTYSAAGQVLQEEAGNGVVSEYHYEAPTLRLSRLVVMRPGHSKRSSLLQDLNYRYDPVGNILSIEDAAQPVRYHQNQRIVPLSQYEYDALYQLLTASGRENANAGQQGPALPPPEVPLSRDPNRYSNYTRSYQYDRGGNLTLIRHQGSKSYSIELVVAPTSNRAIQQTGFLTPGDIDRHFDACGNLLQLAPGQPLAWDGRNQLQQVIQVQRDEGPDDREWYRYGGGQRLLKTNVSQTSGTQRQAEVIYLPGLELRRTTSTRDGAGTTVEALQVIHGQAAGRAQVRVLHWDNGQPADIPNDQVRYSLDDQLGSSLLEVDQAADILTLEEYYPYGGTAVWAGKSLSETQYKFVRYSGKERDATGLYYYGFRYYAPWIGRWLNPDPAGTVDGLNLFQMVGNNPVTLYDTDGLMRTSRGRGTGATASGTSRPSIAAASASSAQPGQSTRGRGALAARDTVTSTAGRGRPSPSRGQSSSTALGLGARGRGARGNSRVSSQNRPKTTGGSQAPEAPEQALTSSIPAVPDVPARPLYVDLASLDIGGAAANDEFFDPNLEARLQAYKEKHSERFAAMRDLKHEVTDTQIESHDPRSGVYFLGYYKRDSWIFSIVKRGENAKYFGADVTMLQYEIFAKKAGFFGYLPKTVRHGMITNEITKPVLKKHLEPGNSESFFDEFINETPNGKTIQRSLDVFGLEAYGFVNLNNGGATVAVRRIQNPRT
jgi:insecticidal toxin complex protein TccC